MARYTYDANRIEEIIESTPLPPALEEEDLSEGSAVQFTLPPTSELIQLASDVLSREQQIVAQLSDDQIRELAQRIGEATRESVDEHRDQLTEALKEASNTSKKQRAMELIVTSAVGKVLEYGFENADVIADTVVELLASVL